MAIDFMEFLKETFDDVEDLDHEKMKTLASETVAYLESLESVLTHGDPDSKAEAMNAALEVKEFLESKTNQAAERSGMNAEEFRDIVKTPSMFTSEEKDTIVDISNHLDFKKNKTKIKKLKPIHLS